MGKKNKKKKKDKQRVKVAVGQDTLDAFPGADEVVLLLPALFSSRLTVTDEEMKKLFEGGGAGAYTATYIQALVDEGNKYAGVDELVLAVQNWRTTEAPAPTPKPPAQPPSGMQRTSGPPGTDQVVQFLTAQHCNLFNPRYQRGTVHLLKDSVRLVTESGSGVMTVIQMQELNTDQRSFDSVDQLIAELLLKKKNKKANSKGKMGWEDLKEQYEGVDNILSFLTTSNMFLAETVITMDLMRQMMESVPGNDYHIILKYLEMFKTVSTKFASFTLLIENLRRCARNDKSLATAPVEEDATEAKRKRKKKKKEAKRRETRKMALLEFDSKKSNGTLEPGEVDPRVEFMKEDEKREKRRNKRSNKEEELPQISEMSATESRKLSRRQTNDDDVMKSQMKRKGKSTSGRDPRGGMGASSIQRGQRKASEDGNMLPSIGKNMFPAL